ncbi:hypothetical protein C0995_010430 [Termitomyces sp. Mi166|nr:hypothetical protein C0995_010430 [Termitomyces sp. Mi166\
MQNELPAPLAYDPFPINDDSDRNWEYQDWVYDQVESQNTNSFTHDEMRRFNGMPLYPLRLEKLFFQTHNDERNRTYTYIEPSDSERTSGKETKNRTHIQSDRCVELPSLVYTDRPEYSLIQIYAPRPIYAYSQRSILDFPLCELELHDSVARQQGKLRNENLTEKLAQVHPDSIPKLVRESSSTRRETDIEKKGVLVRNPSRKGIAVYPGPDEMFIFKHLQWWLNDGEMGRNSEGGGDQILQPHDAEMSLIFTIFALVFVTQLISWIGQKVLLELAYSLYLRVFYSSTSAQLRAKRKEVLNTKAELLKTSAQDQFAKWAKLRRSVDKGIAELEKLNSDVASTKTAFSIKFNSAIWLLTTGVQFFVGWWYRKTAVFYLPPGWFGPLRWWLSFPFAPVGSVSVGVWQMACKRVILIGERVVKDLILGSSQATAEPAAKEKSSEKET